VCSSDLDHETAGFSIIGGLNGSIAAVRDLPSDAEVLDPEKQPARQKLVGTYDTAGFPEYNILADGFPETYDIDGKILFGFGANGDRFETLLSQPRPIIDSLLSSNIAKELETAGYPRVPVQRGTQHGYFIRGQAVGHDQAVHTGADIPVTAFSSVDAVASQFVGVQRNTDVFFKIARGVFGGY
jgi:alkaline phosphatase